MVSDKFILIVKRLIAATEEGKLDWQPGAQRDSFVVALSNYAVTLYARKTFEGQTEDIVVQLSNSDGEVVEQVADVDFPERAFGGTNSYQVLKQLHDAARRKALGVEAAFDEILSQLPKTDDEDIPF